jgi:metal-dependent HD superfamily phosphatase/phosphodiesterase
MKNKILRKHFQAIERKCFIIMVFEKQSKLYLRLQEVYTVKLGYNDHGYNEFTLIANNRGRL